MVHDLGIERVLQQQVRHRLAIRITLTPRSASFSVSRSTAVLLGAHTSTRRSRRMVSMIACTNVVVLPVPGEAVDGALGRQRGARPSTGFVQGRGG
jgi:hypothetical protein